jgi:hypothetical protein
MTSLAALGFGAKGFTSSMTSAVDQIKAGSFEEARRGWRERYAELPTRLLERNDWLLVHVGRAALGSPSPADDGPAPARAACSSEKG